MRRRVEAIALWTAVGLVAVLPVAVAAASPLLNGRDAIWIAGGMAGVLALSTLFLQPLFVANRLPGTRGRTGLSWHRLTGAVTLLLVIAHVGGLYIYSPEDIADALLLVAPTPFSLYGVIGLVALLLTAALAAGRRRLRLAPALWRALHMLLAATATIAGIVHAWMIEGAMGDMTKAMICAAALLATLLAVKTRLRPSR
ncbi:ferric reductase-like transmembrane domain-containing protein [Rhizobiaceae bacterium BDR2-2]|uniref:Ferric reductase-like transmembrane domain-containing protein n=1 Tax=Ectorhizobium quercum TaxID=2965071 RepID=A0AAE3MY78_9HYPH|nr:ferric reductase-like transmembrane domain-containing protein [Ectorhizobium quercum]MCX8996651.1 ferric reductase-like transmembrane domain-containing protein [Ectorhizobium quercum]